MPTLVGDPRRWRRAKGMVAGTICTLVEIGWKPAAPDRWVTADNVMAMVGTAPFAAARILVQATAAIQERTLRQNSAHAHSDGIGKHPSLEPARKVQKHFLRKGMVREAAAVDYLVVGALSDPVAGPNGILRDEDMCHRCGGKVAATRKHTIWTCPHNIHDEQEKMLARQAERGWDEARCLWARGITPSRWYSKSPPNFDEARRVVSGDFTGIAAKTGRVYTDGAGADKDTAKEIVRVASGAAVFTTRVGADGIVELKESACIAAEVPGKQTVPRAEVWAAILALHELPDEIDVVICIDAWYAVLTRRTSEKGKPP